jgi:hypothetical protein
VIDGICGVLVANVGAPVGLAELGEAEGWAEGRVRG